MQLTTPPNSMAQGIRPLGRRSCLFKTTPDLIEVTDPA